MTITYEWRGDFDNAAVSALHAEGFNHRTSQADWLARVHRHSLGWVCARHDGDLARHFKVGPDQQACCPPPRRR